MPIIPSPPSLSQRLSSTISKFKSSSHQTLSLLESCKSLKEFHQLHARIITRGQTSDPFVSTRMLEFCAVSGDMDSAVPIFRELNQPNVYMWTAVIRGFVNVKNPQKAIELYDQMRSIGILPYKFTFIFVLKACSFVKALQKGRAVHGSLVKVGLQTDAYLSSALVTMYGNCSDTGGAYRLFREVPTDDKKNSVIIWNAMISRFFENGDIKRAEKLFDEMPERDVTTWNVAVNGYSKLGRMDLARALFDEMPERNLLTWSSMVDGYVQGRRGTEALGLFQEMLHAGIRPDGITMASALAACSQTGALDVGKWIHSYVDKNRIRRDVVLDTSLLDMYAKCGSIDLALQVFDGMLYKNVSSWNALLCGLAMHGQGDEALEVFRKMESAHVRPTDVTFVGVLCACCHVGAVEEGRRQFKRMSQEFEIVPKIEHYGCMVDLLGRAGLVNEAGDLIVSMPMEPNLIVMGAFLRACEIHGGDFSGSECLLKQISKFDPGDDGGFYVLLSNVYASRNQWDEVAEMRKLIKGMGVRKIPGCSAIEVNSVVHEFVVEDKSHPSWREVFEAIERLSSHLDVEEGCMPKSSLVSYAIDE